MRETQWDASATTRSTALAAICWILAGLVYLLAEAVAASAFPHYSYALNYISDLGVPDVEMLGDRFIDSPLHMVINVAFLAHGVLFATAAVCMPRRAQRPLRLPIITLALIHALGMVAIASVHGGQASSELGLGWVHLLGALFAFIGALLSMIGIGISLLRNGHSPLIAVISIGLGVIGILGIVMLQIDVRAVPRTLLPDGVWERIGMYAIVVWEVIFGWVLLRRRHRPPFVSEGPATVLD